MKPYSCLIIDDEDNARELLKSYLTNIPDVHIMGECRDGLEALKSISSMKPDLIILDIQMPKLSGFEVLEVCEHNPVVIFSTAFEEYAIKAFELNAADYLLKPYSEDRLRKAVFRALSKIDEPSAILQKIENIRNDIPEKLQRIVVKTGQAIEVIPVSQILYFKAEDDYVMIYTSKGHFLKQMTMQYLENHLEADTFARVHRSYIVKLSEKIGRAHV